MHITLVRPIHMPSGTRSLAACSGEEDGTHDHHNGVVEDTYSRPSEVQQGIVSGYLWILSRMMAYTAIMAEATSLFVMPPGAARPALHFRHASWGLFRSVAHLRDTE
jgi:hypothetical protein